MLVGKKKNSWKFSSSFFIKGSMVSTISEVGRALNSISSLKQVGKGTIIKYEVLEEEVGKRFVELGSNSVRLIFYFNEQNKKEHAASLIKFLSILAIIDGYYKFELKSLYVYIIEALRWSLPYTDVSESNQKVVERLSWNLKNMTFANASLSNEIFESKKRVEEIEMELKDYRAFCKGVIDSVPNKEDGILKDLESNFGINPNITGRVCALIKKDR